MLDKIKSLFSKKGVSIYQNEFNSAVKLTNKLCLGNYKYFKNSNFSYFDDQENVLNLIRFLKSEGWDIRNLKLDRECLTIHYNIKQYIDEFYKIDSILTIGYLESSDDKQFYESIEQRLSNLENPINSAENHLIHAWLTLPNLEILDFTYFTTEAVKTNNPERYGHVFAKHGDDDLLHRYKPQLVGVEYLIKAGYVKNQ